MQKLERAQRMVLRIHDATMHEKGLSITSQKCGELGRDLGYDSSFPARYPRLFEVSPGCVRLSQEAKKITHEERIARRDTHFVYVIRKLLMMCKNERIPTVKLMRNKCFRFPDALTQRILTQYPEYFHWEKRPLSKWGMLRLVSWEDRLGTTAREKVMREIERYHGSVQEFKEQGLPVENDGGLDTIVMDDREFLELYKEPLLSPYKREVLPAGNRSLQRKRYIGLFHEFISLTRNKRACLLDMVDFQEEFETPDMAELESFFRRERKYFAVKHTEGHVHVLLRQGYDWDLDPELGTTLQGRRRFLKLMTCLPEEDAAQA